LSVIVGHQDGIFSVAVEVAASDERPGVAAEVAIAKNGSYEAGPRRERLLRARPDSDARRNIIVITSSNRVRMEKKKLFCFFRFRTIKTSGER
jgi:hypothetical protein